MAIPCPRCGRQYDATLFAFGRTLDCACGERVGLRAEIRRHPGPPRFAADAMLGRLARWLRLLGFDTFWEAHIQDGALARRAVEEGRTLLTRDRRLPLEWRVEGVFLVEAEKPREQLREVVRAFRLRDRVRPFTRCSRCNAELGAAPEERVRAEVPARIRAQQRSFLACPGCGRLYWQGSHTERIRAVLDDLEAKGA